MANTERICYFARLPVRSCRVDPTHGRCIPYRRSHGLAEIRGNEWVAGIAQGLNVVMLSRFRVADVRVEHEVKLKDFTKWLDRTGGSPREVRDRLVALEAALQRMIEGYRVDPIRTREVLAGHNLGPIRG